MLVARVAERRGDRIGEAEAHDRARLERDDRGFGGDTDDADPVGASRDRRRDVRAVALQVLNRRLVAAVAVRDLLRIGRWRGAEDERARARDVDRAREVRVREIDAAVYDADVDAVTRGAGVCFAGVDDRHVPLARRKLVRSCRAGIRRRAQPCSGSTVDRGGACARRRLHDNDEEQRRGQKREPCPGQVEHSSSSPISGAVPEIGR
jgi:hypothetical protein